MLYNYILTAWRTIKNDRLFSVINIMGLAIGLTASIAIMQYVVYQYSYDDFHEKGDDIYRLASFVRQPDNEEYTTVPSNTMAGPRFLQDFPEVEEMLRVDYFFFENNKTLQFKDENGQLQAINSSKGIIADSNFFSFFSFPLVSGNPKQILRKPATVLISETMAKTWFPNENPIGKILSSPGYGKLGPLTEFMIEGIFKDIPSNSHLAFDYIVSNTHAIEEWDAQKRYQTYLKLHSNTDLQELTKNSKYLKKEAAISIGQKWNADFSNWYMEYRFQPLKDIHLNTTYIRNEYIPRQDKEYLNLLSLVGLLILIIALTNYINLSTAKAMKRRKEVGIRKAVGAKKWQLIGQFMLESFFLVSVAFLLAITFLQIASTLFEGLKGWREAMMMWQNPTFLPYLLSIYLLSGVLAGTYPAFVLSRFQPLTILGGNKLENVKGFNVRRTLVVFQYIATIGLIIFVFGMYRQLVYLQNQKLGFQADQLLVISAPKLNKPKTENGFSLFESSINNINGVKGITASLSIPGKHEGGNIFFKNLENPNIDGHAVSSGGVSHDFVDVYGIPILYGRNFSRDMPTDSSAVIVSEKYIASHGYVNPADAIGNVLIENVSQIPAKIIGVIPDFEVSSFHQLENNRLGSKGLALCLRAGKLGWMRDYRYFTLRINPATSENLLPILEKTYLDLFPGQSFEYFFLDEQFRSLYQSDQEFRNLLATLAILAVVLAGLGLFGLTLFNVQRRTKEISIRKVCGASLQDILKLLIQDYFFLILISIVIAVPISTWALLNWQENYIYQIPLSIGLYILPILLVVLIATLTMIGQTWKAAKANPVEFLRAD